MLTRFTRCFAAGDLLAVTAATVLLASGQVATGQAARAGDDCLAAPDRSPGSGGHWYYHLDRGRDRKCWYLVEPEARAPTPEPTQPQPPPAQPQPAPEPSSLQSFFSTLSTGFAAPGTAPQPPAPAPAPAPDTYNTQSIHPDDKSGGATAPRPVHAVRHTDADVVPTAKPQHPAPAKPRPGPADDHSAAPSGQTERDALFQEFLRWRAHQ